MIKSINRPNVKVRYKLYKRKKKWMVSGISTIAAAGLMVAVQTVANADTVTTTTDGGVTPEQSSTGGNAVNKSTAISQNVTVDHSNLDKAVQDAKAAGLNPKQQPTTSQTVTEDQSDQAESQIKSDYDKQTEQINNTTAQYLHDKHNYEAYNNYEGDHSALDNVVNQAQQAGVEVNKTQETTTTLQADDDNKINEWKNNTQKDYEQQAAEAQKALDEAKRLSSVQDNMVNNPSQGYTGNNSITTIYSSATMPSDGNIKVSLSGSGNDYHGYNVSVYGVDSAHLVSSIKADPNQVSLVSGQWVANPPQTSSASASLTDRNLKTIPQYGYSTSGAVALWGVSNGAVLRFANAVTTEDGAKHDLYVKFEADGKRWANEYIGVFVTDEGSVESTIGGIVYPSAGYKGPNSNSNIMTYWIGSQGSQEKYLTTYWEYDIDEGQTQTTTDSVVLALGGGMTLHQGKGTTSIQAKNTLGDTEGNNHTAGSALNGLKSEPDGMGLVAVYGNGIVSKVQNTPSSNAVGVDQGLFGSATTSPQRPSLNYHYTKLNISKITEIPKFRYVYHDLNVLSTPHKDVGVGTQSGEVTESTDGKLVPKGSNVTFSLTMPDMPAYRTDDIKSRVTVDHLDPNFGYESLKAFVKDDSGKLQDMTDHVKVTKDGNDLYITEDATLLARYNQDKTKKVSMPIFNLYGTALKDQSKILNTYDIYVNDGKATSNTVTIPTPDTPEPVKKDLNDQGVDINGKNLLPGEKPIFEISADYDQYTGINADEVEIDKGFYIIDDYPEEAVTIDPSKVTAKDSQNASVELEYSVYKSLDEAPDNVKLAVARSGLNINGAFLVASPKDNKDYFTKYIQTGNSITITIPAEVREGYSGKFNNSAYEVDFGNGYATNVVVNTVPKLDPKKDVVVSVDNLDSLDNKDVKLAENIDYRLEGPVIPANQGYPITEYGWDDDYDQEHDQYNGYFVAELTTDVTLKDGTVLKAGTDITKYVTQVIDAKNGAVHYDVDKDFLAKVDTTNSEFGADNFMQVKRIKTGDVENTYTSRINGKKYRSNTVVTHTKEKPKSEPTPCHCDTPKPEPEVPEMSKTVETPAPQENATAVTPVVASVMPEPQKQDTPKEATLPQTGDSNSEGLVLTGFAALLLALGNLGFAFKKKKVA